MKSIYLAGPDVFLPNAVDVGIKKSILCKKYGFKGNYPLDNEIVEYSYPTKRKMGFSISKANQEMIRKSDIVIANLTPFRGPNADVGTVFEVGYACALGKLVVGYSNMTMLHTERVKHGSMINAGHGMDANDMFIEDFDLNENLMIDGGIENSGGFFLTQDVPFCERYTSLVVFEECLKKLQFIA